MSRLFSLLPTAVYTCLKPLSREEISSFFPLRLSIASNCAYRVVAINSQFFCFLFSSFLFELVLPLFTMTHCKVLWLLRAGESLSDHTAEGAVKMPQDICSVTGISCTLKMASSKRRGHESCMPPPFLSLVARAKMLTSRGQRLPDATRAYRAHFGRIRLS